MVPTSRGRVQESTASAINAQIARATKASVTHYARHPELIEHRLRELDAEWDIERAIEANASVLALAGVTLGATVDKRWLALPVAVCGFLFQHAIQGWCPPVPILRRLGFRTVYEIEAERQALKALRGDFSGIIATGQSNGSVRGQAKAALALAQS